MTAQNNVPDPDRGDADQVNTSDMPHIFQNGESEDSDDDETPNTNGYEMINQDDHGMDDEDDLEGLSMEEQVAALVRAAQTDQNNLGTETRELIEESNERQRREVVEESVKVWSEVKPREDSIQLDEEKVETIKSLMLNIKLPQVPVWAAEMGDEVLRAKILSESKGEKS
eukprot:TRINITY_DN8841_c0_g1_i1.p1 TRINITY_DN8841_c0_g1~~TRINITY_DN8841_c0_g1_i1.p1  ORF type:complete len:170 (-),score=66.62 TRINITY_DN8841_c0_g1_i1:118-627(-)